MMSPDLAKRIEHNQQLARFHYDKARDSRLYYGWLKRTGWRIASVKELATWKEESDNAAKYARDARALLQEWVGE